MDALLSKVKANLILAHSADDELLKGYITAAVSYAESYQHIPEGYYSQNTMPATTEQAVIMLASHSPCNSPPGYAGSSPHRKQRR